ncbi:HDOD domain-containing protein [Duganella callida]|uniref:HDOD domain-containing protein n=1 Tax=Duganella callida TaxID=2561932 RepID=A0A4Y9SPE6_9BURK|nr:HDOD domain-containing protein [Duganella callida]TFW28632.1 HDOD domain-containing protein [Duganella callida]
MIALDEVVRRIHDLPSLPAVVAELLASMAAEDQVDLHYLAGRIALDQALTAKTLRLANSSFYGMPSKVTSIQQAMTVLGLHSVRTLVTACGVIAAIPRAGNLDFDAFWRHAIATAVWARTLARHLRQSPETAFTAGLLHNLGTLVLATRFPDQYAAVQAWRRQHPDSGVAEAEQAVFGVDHTEAGSALSAYWKFPPAIQDAIRHQHDAGASGLALAVGLAHVLAGPPDHGPAQAEQAWLRLGFDDEQRRQTSEQCARMVNDMCQILV